MYPNFLSGIEAIWGNDSISQEYYISYLGEEVRKLPLQIFKDFGAFFVPNEEYLRIHFGDRCTSVEYEIYDFDGYCRLNNSIVFPCLELSGKCVGWVAFNPFKKAEALDTGEYLESYYSYPSARIFDRGSYLFVRPDIYRRSLKDNYLILTDGVFDAINLVYNGFNAASTLGSFVSPNVAFLLSFVRDIYVFMDNDEAGLGMFENVCRFRKDAKYIKQGITKDADDLLKLDVDGKIKKMLEIGISSRSNINLKRLNKKLKNTNK